MKTAATKTTTRVVSEGIYQYVLRPDTYLAKLTMGNSRGKRQVVSKTFRLEDFDDAAHLLREAEKWRIDEEPKLEKPETVVAGTLRDAMARYLRGEGEGTKRQASKKHYLQAVMNAPLDPARPDRGTVGDLRPKDFTREQMTDLVGRWKTQGGTQGRVGAQPGTIQGRIGEMKRLYEFIDPHNKMPNPTYKVKVKQLQHHERRDMSYDLIEQVIGAISNRGEATRLRLRVMAYTGLSHTSLMRLTPRDLDLDGKLTCHKPGPHVYFHPRQKGEGGAPGVWMPVMALAVDALRAFDAANLYGPFNTCTMDGSWTGAIERLADDIDDAAARRAFLAQFPKYCRPYDLRHSFATYVLQTTGSLETTAALLQHTTTRMTKRYAIGAQDEVRVQAIEKLNARILPVPDAPAMPQAA